MLPGARYASMVLRGAFVLALLLGLGFWTTILSTGGLVLLHMLLGLVVVGSVWYLGLVQAQHGGSLGLTLGTFVLGLVVVIFGLAQNGLETTFHSTLPVQIVHLALGLTAVGLGEMCSGRIRRASTKRA
jgi:hypothetical protein